MSSVLGSVVEKFSSEETVFPTLQVDQELYSEIQEGLNGLTQNNGGPLLLVRPPRENDGMEATISVYQTLHNPREKEVGFGPFTFIKNNAHAHAHEIWYHNAQMQFFLRPETKVDANKMRRQVRSNYPNIDISEADQRFPSIEIGEYVSVAEIGLKRDFYFPIKSKLHNNEDFDLDPYGDITSDMVVEEDQTSDGRQVEAKDCKLVVQTIFESARDVWSKSRPYGMDVNEVAQGMKEGEVYGNRLKGYDTRSPGTLQTRSAKILETLRGSKAYYITMRVIAISPYEEIAERRCRNVAYDFETYYNTTTQQGLTPIELTEGQMRESLLEAVRREHDIGFRDRFMSSGKFLQPVATLGSLAHIPNEEINTPVIDWAKQDTGPGTPSSGDQLEDQKRESEKQRSEGGHGGHLFSDPMAETTTQDQPVEPQTTEQADGEASLDDYMEANTTPETNQNHTTPTSDVRSSWSDRESGSENNGAVDVEPNQQTPTGTEDSGASLSEIFGGGGGEGGSENSGAVDAEHEPEAEPEPEQAQPTQEAGRRQSAGRREGGRGSQQSQSGSESTWASEPDSEPEAGDDEDDGSFTPAFAAGNRGGWGDDDDDSTEREDRPGGRRR